MSYQIEQKLRDDDTSDTKWAIAFFDLMQNMLCAIAPRRNARERSRLHRRYCKQ
ncbi:hypothetical protein [Nostoc sp. CALU 1950]|uniref:hypothetical protein n=1 Tax=Nostoc sp. CALU 1950 TaxID=3104321 RepID=UPI003EC01FD6